MTIKCYILPLFLALLTGCMTISELDRLDLAAHVEKWLERSETSTTPNTPDAPAESTTQPSSTEDEIDLAAVVWYGPDIRGWDIASDLNAPTIDAKNVTFPHSKAGRWPTDKSGDVPVEGNPWIIVQIGGKWRAASFEWLKPGQTSKPIKTLANDHTKQKDWGDWSITQGEECYIIVSALARGNKRSVPERTVARKVVWK